MAAPIATWTYIGPTNQQTFVNTHLGPAPISGRKSGVAFLASTVYTTSHYGGLWKSVNGGVNFVPLSDQWPSLQASCVAINPTNANFLLVGTGLPFGIGINQSMGIMRSTDGGASWFTVGQQFASQPVTAVHISAQNPNVAVALTLGTSGDIWRSIDSGLTWSRTNAPDGGWDDLDTSGSVWVAVSGQNGLIARSTDQGATWNTLPAPGGSGERWNVAISKLSSSRIYVLTQGRHLYRTSNSGGSWVDLAANLDLAVSDPNGNWGQSDYNLAIDCGRAGASDLVFAGLITLCASEDNGTTWTDIGHSQGGDSAIHTDQLGVFFDPLTGNSGYLINDGGLTRFSYDLGSHAATFDPSPNRTIKDFLCYTVRIHPSGTSFVMTGMQDNATGASRGDFNQWSNLYGGDGGYTVFKQNEPAVHYTTSQNGHVYRYPESLSTMPDEISPGQPGAFITPIVHAGPLGDKLLLGVQGAVMRYPGLASAWDMTAAGSSNIVTLYNPPSGDGNRINASSIQGNLFQSTDAFSTHRNIKSNLPSATFLGIAESPANSNTLFVTRSVIGEQNTLFRTITLNNASPYWASVSGLGNRNLPAVPARDVVVDPLNPKMIYVATDIGVFMSPFEGDEWYNLNPMGLPNVPVYDLELKPWGNGYFLYAATLGRGIWRINLGSRFLQSFTTTRLSTFGGNVLTGVVTLNGSAPVGATCKITDDSSFLSAPSVTIPLGIAQASFPIYTLPVASTQTVNMTATCMGTTVTALPLQLHPVPNYNLFADNFVVYAGDLIRLTMNFDEPLPLDALATFADNSSAVSSPGTLGIKAAQNTKDAIFRTGIVSSAQNVILTTKVEKKEKTIGLTLTPRPALESVTVSPQTVTGGSLCTGQVKLSKTVDGKPIVVTISDSSGLVQTPASVTVPFGADVESFDISTSVVNHSYTITVKATLGTVSKTTTFVVGP